MNRFAVTALTAILFAAGTTAGMAQTANQAGTEPTEETAKEELSGTQPQAKVEGATTGDLTEPTVEKEGAPTGTEGEAASLVDEGTTAEKESDVEGAQAEKMMDKGEPASVTQ